MRKAKEEMCGADHTWTIDENKIALSLNSRSLFS
jgi:hypothetical protein